MDIPNLSYTHTQHPEVYIGSKGGPDHWFLSMRRTFEGRKKGWTGQPRILSPSENSTTSFHKVLGRTRTFSCFYLEVPYHPLETIHCYKLGLHPRPPKPPGPRHLERSIPLWLPQLWFTPSSIDHFPSSPHPSTAFSTFRMPLSRNDWWRMALKSWKIQFPCHPRLPLFSCRFSPSFQPSHDFPYLSKFNVVILC